MTHLQDLWVREETGGVLQAENMHTSLWGKVDWLRMQGGPQSEKRL